MSILDTNPNSVMTLKDVEDAKLEAEESYDKDTGKILFKNRRVTTFKSNKRIVLPKQIDDDRGNDLLRLKKTVIQATEEYKAKNYVEGKDVNENKVMSSITSASKELKKKT